MGFNVFQIWQFLMQETGQWTQVQSITPIQQHPHHNIPEWAPDPLQCICIFPGTHTHNP